MAHELDFSNNRANIAYVGETPWHGLGQQLLPGESIDQWRIAAGLNWNVSESPALYANPKNGELHVAENRKVLLRDDTLTALNIVSNGYNTVQPGEILGFFDSLVKNSGFELETAGSLRGGRRIWALAKTNMELNILGHDLIKGYLLLSTSYDGTMATVASFSTVRVVCMNTFRLAIGENGENADIKIPHQSIFDAEKIKQELGLGEGKWATFGEQVTELATRKVTRKEATDYFVKLFYGDEVDLANAKVEKRLATLHTIYESGVGQETKSAHHTAWGLMNAVTRYFDHEREAAPESRLDNAWFGEGNKKKNEAWKQCMALVA